MSTRLESASGHVHKERGSYSRKSTIIPEVTLVWEAVANEAEFAFLDVLFDRVEKFFFGDLAKVANQ